MAQPLFLVKLKDSFLEVESSLLALCPQMRVCLEEENMTLNLESLSLSAFGVLAHFLNLQFKETSQGDSCFSVDLNSKMRKMLRSEVEVQDLTDLLVFSSFLQIDDLSQAVCQTLQEILNFSNFKCSQQESQSQTGIPLFN